MVAWWWETTDFGSITIGTSFLVAESRKICGGIDGSLVLFWRNLWSLLLLELQVVLPSCAGDFKEIADVLESFILQSFTFGTLHP